MNPLVLVTSPAQTPIRYLLLVALILATVVDLKRRRIPNLITFPTALFAFVLHGVYGGAAAVASSLLAFLMWFLFGFLFYRTVAGKEIGAGDIKLVMAISACVGFLPAAYMTFISLVLAIAFLFVRWVLQGTAPANFSLLYRWAAATATSGTEKAHFRPVGMEDKTPHAPFLLAAALLSYWLYQRGLLLN